MPDNVTADRLDRVQADQLIHLEPFALTTPVPEDGWQTVRTVALAGDSVTVGFDDESTFVGAANRLVRIGW